MEQNSAITSVKELIREKIRRKEPAHYDVIMYNDDYTTKDFVVAVLISVFNKNVKEAVALMEKIHTTGKSTVGTYPYDLAVTLTGMVQNLAAENEFPLRCSVQEHT